MNRKAGGPQADIDGMGFFTGQVRAGSAFLLSRAAAGSALETMAGWTVQLTVGSRVVVARGPGGAGYETARDESLDAANRGLDMLTAGGGGDYWIRNAEDEHIVWWMEGSASVVRVLSAPTFMFSVGTPTISGGKPIVLPVPEWHESLRYFRLSQTTDDLFDSYRNLYLALESILDSIAPQRLKPNGRLEGEGEWFKRALDEAGQLVALASFAEQGVADPAQNLWEELYRERRTAIFHSKSSRVYLLPHSSEARQEVARSLSRMVGLYRALSQHITHVRRPQSGIFAGFWRLQTDSLADGVEIVATDDPTEFSADAREVNPAGGQVVHLVTEPAPEYDRPFQRAFLGQVDGHELKTLGRITGLCSVAGRDPLTAHIPEGVLRLAQIDRFEVLLKLRAQNVGHPKSLFAS